jgi:hypothetical protein
MRAFIARCASGVFPSSRATTVGNNPDPIPSVGRIDGDSWNNERPYFVTFRFQVSAHLFEYHAFVPSNKAANIFTDDPSRPELSNNPKHFRPEVAVVRRSLSSSGLAEGLARESARKDKYATLAGRPLRGSFAMFPRFSASFARGVGSKGSYVAMDLCVRPMFLEDGLAEGVYLAKCVIEGVFSEYVVECITRSSDAGEQV